MKIMKNTRNGGFTLVELAIVMVIIGILLAAIMPLYGLYMTKKKEEGQEAKIGIIRTAIADFIIDDDLDPSDPTEARFPCPAPVDAPPGSPDYGVEQCITGAPGTCSNGVCIRAGTGGRPVLIGAIPTRTIAISGDNMSDVYGNRFTYAVSADLTEPNAMSNNTTIGAVSVIDEGGTVTNEAQFALVSHGRDGAGSHTALGVPNGLGCRTGGDGDSENCNNDAVFRFNEGETGANISDYYDDGMVFTLIRDQDDQWWRQVDDAGNDIVNRNPMRVAIGVAGAPTERLDVEGNVRARQDHMADRDVRAGQDTVATRNATAGQDVVAGRDVTAGGNVNAGQDVLAGRDVTASRSVIARQNVTADIDVLAGRNLEALGGFARASTDVLAGRDVLAVRDVRASVNLFAGVDADITNNVIANAFFYRNGTPLGGGGGGGGPSTPLTASCPTGQVLRAIVSNSPQCVSVSCPSGYVYQGLASSGAPICVLSGGGTGMADMACDSGEFVIGFTAGTPVCGSPVEAGLVETFFCTNPDGSRYGKGDNGLPAEDGVSGYTAFADNWCTHNKGIYNGLNIVVTMGSVADACIDPANNVNNRAEAMPIEFGGKILQFNFSNTCGKRWCEARGFQDGRVTEQGPSGFSLADGKTYTVPGDTDAEKRPVEIKCTKI